MFDYSHLKEAHDLFEYQREGALWLSFKKKALLADEMGLGKTAQAIRACDLNGAKRILVLCPAVARENWKREFIKFSRTPRSYTVINSGKNLPEQWESVVICSYDLVDTVLAKNLNFDVMVLDESHFLRNLQTRRTLSVLGNNGLVHRAKRTWALSGTPAPNNVAELWPLLFTFGQTPYKYEAFVERYCKTYRPHFPSATPRIVGLKKGHLKEITDALKIIMLRRKKEDVLKELPPIFYDDIVLEAGHVPWDTLTSFGSYRFPIDRKEELFAKLEQESKLLEQLVSTVGNGEHVVKSLEAIQTSISSIRMWTGIQKVDKVAELVTQEFEDNKYDKLVIFAIHRDVIDGLKIKLAQFNPLTLYGGTPWEKRDKHIDKFQNTTKFKVFIGNITAAGTAITLTRANHVLFAEQSFCPADNAQAVMRCHRIGQEKTVFVRFVGLANSIDERISAILKRKTRDLTNLFDA